MKLPLILIGLLTATNAMASTTDLRQVGTTVENVNELNPTRTLTDRRSQENVLWGAFATISYKISPNHKLGFNYLRNQNGISTATFQEGEIPADQPGLFFQTRALEYEQNALNQMPWPPSVHEA